MPYGHLIKTNSTNRDTIKAFDGAGAYLATVTPALSSSSMNAVELTIKFLDALAEDHVRDSELSLNEQMIPFTSANFLQVIQTVKVSLHPLYPYIKDFYTTFLFSIGA